MNLENNSNEMKTVVETFIIEETAELIYDGEKLDQWNKKIEELGLTGQQCIVKPEKSPIPFMHLKQTTKNMFEVLCPRKIEVEKYDKTPIPLEILDLIALSKKEQYFEKLQIWYDDKTPDPCCIGMLYKNESDRKNGYYWNMDHYLLGKWSDVKQSFEELKQRAIKRFKEERTNQLRQSIKQSQRELDDLDATAFNQFGSYTEQLSF